MCFVTFEVMGRAVHKMSDLDLSAGKGVCAKCGPVDLSWRMDRGVQRASCPIGRAEGRISEPGKTRGWDGVVGKHGLTAAEARALREGKSCEICGSTERLVVDHCHNTKIIRGILCHHCNLALGHFKDKINLLAMAVVYLSGDRVLSSSPSMLS